MKKILRKYFCVSIYLLGILCLCLLAMLLYTNSIEAVNDRYTNMYGRVTDSSGNPIQGVNVYFGDGQNPVFTTDADGNWSVWINEGNEGSLRFEYPNYTIETAKQKKISYYATKHLDVVLSLPEENQLKEVYHLVDRKLAQILISNGKNYESSVNYTTNVIGEGERQLNLNRQSIGCMHICYAEETRAQNMITALNQAGRLYNQSYELIVQPSSDGVKNSIQSQVRSKLLAKVQEPREINKRLATEIVKSICERNTLLSRMEGREEDLGFQGTQTDSIVWNEDEEINITMKVENGTNPSPSPSSSTPSTFDFEEGSSEIKGQAKDVANNPIPNVQVRLYQDGIEKESSIRTDATGNYEFTGLENDHTYKVQFTYGDEIQLTNDTKYNGQDYETANGGTISYTTSNTEETYQEEDVEIKEPDTLVSEAGDMVDVYLLIDSSSSMNALLFAKQGAKDFITKIFDTYGDNARIGLIAFSHEVYKCSSLVGKDQKDTLFGHIDNMTQFGSTNTELAIQEAINSFKNESDENHRRYAIVLTDGYCRSLGQEYQWMANEGINAFTIFVGEKKDDKEEWKYQPGEILYIMKTEIVETLGKVAVEYIVEGKIVKVPGETHTTKTNTTTYQTVDNSFAKDITPRNFVEVGYNSPLNYIVDDTLSNLTDFADATKMIAEGEITIPQANEDTDCYFYNNADLVLQEREKPKITMEKMLDNNSIKVKLSDGTYLINQAEGVGTQYFSNLMGTGVSQQLITIDEEIIHGATLQVEYHIKLTNKCSYPVKVKLYDYASRELLFVKQGIDGNAVNNDWEIATDALGINNTMKEKITNGERVVLVSREIEIPATDSAGNPGSAEINIVFNKVLAAGESYEYENDVEIGFYANDTGRMLFDASGNNRAVPGSFDVDFPDPKPNGTREWDTVSAPLLSIVPPFGKNWFDLVKTKDREEIFNSYFNIYK